MSTPDALNGTNVFIEVREQPANVWTPVGGQVSHTETLTNDLIEVTSKSADESSREILPNRGVQMIDYSTEVIFVSQSGYDFVRALADNKGIAEFRISSEGNFPTTVMLMVESFVDNSENSQALRGTINLKSSDTFGWDL